MTTLDEILQGIGIIRRYEPNAKITVGHDLDSDFDAIYVGDTTSYKQMTDEEARQMELLSWFAGYDGWMHLVDE